MKISYMLKREDFYTINDRTLKSFYRDGQGKTKLYVYPELNAIVTAHPSKKVRNYLYTEFRVNASPLKRLAVWSYSHIFLNSQGFLAARSFDLPATVSADMLIYPCNKKYRIFDFKRNEVSVTPKSGFPIDDLKNEIFFRRTYKASFIPPLLSAREDGYTEQIIDGYPLARAGTRSTELTQKAVDLWDSYISTYTKAVLASDYSNELLKEVNDLCEIAKVLKPDFLWQNASMLAQHYASVLLASNETIPVSLSHGDLQPGNIWVENRTDRIFIIDWESYAKRSVWYDRATLYDNIRKVGGMAAYTVFRDVPHMTVALEDLAFRLHELLNLPLSYGTTEINDYMLSLKG